MCDVSILAGVGNTGHSNKALELVIEMRKFDIANCFKTQIEKNVLIAYDRLFFI